MFKEEAQNTTIHQNHVSAGNYISFLEDYRTVEVNEQACLEHPLAAGHPAQCDVEGHRVQVPALIVHDFSSFFVFGAGLLSALHVHKYSYLVPRT
jgi:hypothetical protein